jgi:hypothetical protein
LPVATSMNGGRGRVFLVHALYVTLFCLTSFDDNLFLPFGKHFFMNPSTWSAYWSI